MLRKFLLIAVLAFTQSGDTMLNVALVWTALRESSSATTLSIVLTVMTIAPFLMQVLLPRTKQWMAGKPAEAFRIARLSGIAIGVAGLLLPAPLSLGTLYALAGAFAIVVYLAQQSLETMMSKFVLAGTVDSNDASRMLQTGTQLGAFLGGSLGGLLFETAGIRAIFAVLCATVVVGALAPSLLARATAKPAGKHAEGAAQAAPRVVPGSPAQRLTVLWSALIAIGLLTVQVGGFNLFVPILCEKVKHWQASDYGIVTASAGLGALIATVRLVPARFQALLGFAAILAIAGCDVGLWLTGNVLLAALFAALAGFSVNTLRIAQRASIYEHVANPEEGAEWSGRTTVMFQATKATVPLVLAGALAVYGIGSAGAAFAVTGAVLGACLLMLVAQQIRLSGVMASGASALRASAADLSTARSS
jgi:hypothetical protein